MWFLPTHKRPTECQRFLDAAIELGTSSPGVVLVNGGPQPLGYESLRLPEGWRVVHRPYDMTCCQALNWAWQQFPDEPWYGFVSDDNIPRTQGWDRKLLDTLQSEDVAWVSSNDGWQAPRRFHGAVLWRGDLLKQVGYIAAPKLKHMFMDDMWETLGRDTGLWRVNMDVLVEHLHYMNNKAQLDAVYGENDKVFDEDRWAFNEWLNTERHQVLERLGFKAPTISKTTNLQGKSILFIVPAHGNSLTTQTAYGLLDCSQRLCRMGLSFGVVFYPQDSLITVARNRGIRDLIQSGMSHLMFVDSDMEFTADDVLRLLASEQELIAAAGTRKRDDKISFCINGIGLSVNKENGLIAADSVGTGFMLIARTCIDKMLAAYPHLRFRTQQDSEELPLLFDCSHVDGSYWSEDYTFCHRWKEIGGTVWVDPNIQLGHVGSKVYRGRLLDVYRHPSPWTVFDNIPAPKTPTEPPAFTEAAE